MKCLMDKSREVSYPCSHACPLFGDCVVGFEVERSAGGMGGHGHKHEDIVAFTPQTYLPTTNGDRVRDMCDGEMAKFFAKKVIDQVAWIKLREGVQMIGGTQLAAMEEACAFAFFSWLRSPAEEANYG